MQVEAQRESPLPRNVGTIHAAGSCSQTFAAVRSKGVGGLVGRSRSSSALLALPPPLSVRLRALASSKRTCLDGGLTDRSMGESCTGPSVLSRARPLREAASASTSSSWGLGEAPQQEVRGDDAADELAGELGGGECVVEVERWGATGRWCLGDEGWKGKRKLLLAKGDAADAKNGDRLAWLCGLRRSGGSRVLLRDAQNAAAVSAASDASLLAAYPGISPDVDRCGGGDSGVTTCCFLWWCGGSSDGLHDEDEFSLLLDDALCSALDVSASMLGDGLACGMVLLLLDCSCSRQ